MPEDTTTETTATIEAPAAAAQTETPATPAETPEPKSPANPWDDPKAAQAEIEKLRRENGAARTNAKAQAAEDAKKELAQTIGKALGLVEDEAIDPAKLTSQLTQAQTQAKQAALELAVFRATPDASTAAGLLDSRSFLAKVADLDPSDTAAITAAVTAAVAENPALGKRAPAPLPGQGASEAGTAGQLTQADLDGLARDNKYAEIEKARVDGRLNTLLGIKT